MKRGTIVLTPFPFFTRLADPTTSQPIDLPLSPSHADFAATGLKVPSVVKCDKLATVHRHILLGELGNLSASLTERLDACLRCALDL